MAVETSPGTATAPVLRKQTEAERERDQEAFDAALAGLDALDTPVGPERSSGARAWSATWPKLAALAVFFLLWQVVVWSGWKPTYVLPGPGAAFSELGSRLHTSEFWSSVGRTMKRAVIGYAVALAVGLVIGIAVARVRIVRTAIGSFIAALQTMPSIVWFPLAILLFQTSESAITFVVVLGAAPAIAGGVISGIDYIPPLLVRVGRSMGARGPKLYRHVIVPAAMPSFVAGMKQGWAFAWGSL
ncbi:MAG: ABC transporter permease, partial [Frankia sp.]